MRCSKCDCFFTVEQEDDLTFGWQCPYCLCVLCESCAEQFDGVEHPVCPSCGIRSG